MNLLARGDAEDLGRWVPAGSADLVYLDPPFSVGITFGARTREKEHRATGPRAYEDRWPSLEAYLAWLLPRVTAAKGCLAARGTFWLHLDVRAAHEAKALCDQVFGRKAFAGEVIWVPGNGSKARRGPSVTHQTLLIYGGGPDYVWNKDDPTLREPYAATSLAMHFTRKDEAGRAYRERVIGKKAYRYYADQGRSLGSVWDDCPAMVANTPLSRETTGYPTQKPLKLLDRIVRAATLPGGLVVDPFCGSGTTLHAAAKAGRRFVGVDLGALAIETTTRRLTGSGIPFTLVDQVPLATSEGRDRGERVGDG